MADDKKKVLVFGSPNGRVNDIINQINKLNASKAGPFDFSILLGDVFPPECTEDEIQAVINGEIDSTIPVYFSDGPLGLHDEIRQKIDSSTNELTGSLIYLASKERIVTIGGISISTYNGDYLKETEGVAENTTTTPPIDILFTHQWPNNITQLTDGFLQSNEITYLNSVMEIAKRFKPKYHFVCNPEKNIFWERQPFYCNEEDADNDKRITRFISLADFQTKDKKWFYAFKIDTTTTSTTNLPKNITTNPYLYSSTPADPTRTELSNIWDDSYTTGNKRDAGQNLNNNRKPKRQQLAINPENCFFCLSNPKIDKALISSIGDEFYLALAKGPLISNDIKTLLGCPGHILIIPMSHVPTYKSLTTNGAEDNSLLEKRKYEIALKQMYSEYGLSYVSFEINRNRGVHIHTQVIGIPQQLVPIIESTFLEEAPKSNIYLEKRDVLPNEEEYFKVTLPDSSTLIASIDSKSRFDLQFGRRVLAIILGIEEQTDWRLCNQSPQEEARDCKEFKTKFKSYDFSL